MKSSGINEIKKLINQNEEKIKKKEAQKKAINDEIKDLRTKTDQLKDDLLLAQIKEIPDFNVTDLIELRQLIKDSGLTDSEVKEMLKNGDVKL